MAAEGEPRSQRPERQVATVASAQGAGEEEQRGGAEEGEQRVRARLLRVPDQHRADRDQGRRDQAGAPVRELGADAVSDRHGGGAKQRRKRADPDLAGAEGLCPGPGEDVVEGRVGLAPLHLLEHVGEAAGDDAGDRDHLVVVVALHAEAGEANRDAEGGEQGQRPEGAGAGWRKGQGAQECFGIGWPGPYEGGAAAASCPTRWLGRRPSWKARSAPWASAQYVVQGLVWTRPLIRRLAM